MNPSPPRGRLLLAGAFGLAALGAIAWLLGYFHQGRDQVPPSRPTTVSVPMPEVPPSGPVPPAGVPSTPGPGIPFQPPPVEPEPPEPGPPPGPVALRIAPAGTDISEVPAAGMDRAAAAETRVRPVLEPIINEVGLSWGAPVYLRLFKEEHEMELWLERPSDGTCVLFCRYPIAAFSGRPGPKLREGDFQSPEGFYAVGPSALNPASSYHLSFNLGFPNEYDRFHQRTGSFLMVHGSTVSIGCYAMTDSLIEEIYTLVAAALRRGQPYVRVHCFPFRMTAGRMEEVRAAQDPNLAFWENLREGYDWFERENRPPDTIVGEGRYVFRSAGSGAGRSASVP